MESEIIVYLHPIFIRDKKNFREFALSQDKDIRSAQYLELDQMPKKKVLRMSVAGVLRGNSLSLGIAFPHVTLKEQYKRTRGNTVCLGRAKKSPFDVITLAPTDQPKRAAIDAVKTRVASWLVDPTELKKIIKELGDANLTRQLDALR